MLAGVTRAGANGAEAERPCRRSARFETSRFKALTLALLGLTLAACGSDPELPPLPADAVILAFGDSLTYGTGAREHQSYPAVLESLVGRTVINAGVPGEVSAEGLRRLPGVVENEAPALVILCHGGNDFLQRNDGARIEQNLRAMVDYLQTQRIGVVLVGVPSFGILLGTHELYEKVAEEKGVPLEKDILSDLLGDNNFKSDHVHPNAAGYRRMAEALRDLLERSGAI